MRRLIGLVMMGMMAVLLPVLVASPAQAAYYCADKMDNERIDFNNDPAPAVVQVTVYYRWCYSNSDSELPYVKPHKVIGQYNVDGTQMNCGSGRKIDGFRFNFYFWRPYNGVNFNPGAFQVDCDESTLNSKMQTYDLSNVPRLYFGPGYGSDRQPRWKANVTKLVNWYWGTDQDKAWSQDFSPTT